MSVTHIVLLLLVVIMIFGTRKLRHIGSDLGMAISDFKRGLDGTQDDRSAPALADVPGVSHPTTAPHPAPRDV